MAIGVGIEITSNAVKLAVLEGGARGVRLRAFDVRKIDPRKDGGAEADVVTVIGELVRKHKVPVTNVVASLRCQDAVVREITVPFTREEQIQKTIKFQAENYFHSVSIDDLIVEYLKFHEADGKSKLLIAGVKKALVDRRLRLLEECEIDPVALDLDVAATVNAYAHAHAFDDKGVVLVVEIEQDQLKVAVVEDGKLRAARAIRMRAGSIRVSGRQKRGSGEGSAVGPPPSAEGNVIDDTGRLPVVILEDDEAQFSLEDSDVSPIERADYLSKIFMEIDRTVAAIRLKRPLDLVCLTGASCALPGIEKIFESELEVKATRVDLSHALGHGDDKKEKGALSPSLQGTAAIGLALKGLGIDHCGLDFRKEEFLPRGRFDPWKRGVACTLCLFFGIAFVTAFGYKQELRERRMRLDGVRQVQEALYTVLFPNLEAGEAAHRPEAVRGNWYESLLFEQKRLQELYGGAGGNPIRGGTLSALEVLREFGEAKAKMPPEWQKLIEVERVRVNPRDDGSQSSFTCSSSDKQAAVVLEQAFRGSAIVAATASDVRQDPRSGKWLFEMVVLVKKKEGG